jgi:glycosyltransferase involved in cell wall biosynthesis
LRSFRTSFHGAPARASGGSLGRSIVLAFVGRLTEEKGCLVLPGAVREAARLTGRRLRLEIAGDGPLRTQLHRRLVAAQVEFEFHGWVDESRRDALLSRAGLLLFPSVWLEPFGLVGIEAASHGVPAVAFPHGGVMEWLIAGKPVSSPRVERPLLRSLAEPSPERYPRRSICNASLAARTIFLPIPARTTRPQNRGSPFTVTDGRSRAQASRGFSRSLPSPVA